MPRQPQLAVLNSKQYAQTSIFHCIQRGTCPCCTFNRLRRHNRLPASHHCRQATISQLRTHGHHLHWRARPALFTGGGDQRWLRQPQLCLQQHYRCVGAQLRREGGGRHAPDHQNGNGRGGLHHHHHGAQAAGDIDHFQGRHHAGTRPYQRTYNHEQFLVICGQWLLQGHAVSPGDSWLCGAGRRLCLGHAQA